MNVLFVADLDATERRRWRAMLEAAAPDLRWFEPGEAFDRAAIAAAVVANPPPGQLRDLPNLRLIQSMWAGVDRLLADPTLPVVPLARMVDPAMSAAMADCASWAVTGLRRGFFACAAAQREARWIGVPFRRADEVPVLVLGRGAMGRAVEQALRNEGHPVQVWHRGRALAPLLPTSAIAINLLPLTADTRGLLDAAFFAALRRGAAIVNLARGAHVVDADLLAALDAGHVAHAVLDVFHQEPLPADHPYWRHPRVTVLPHVAAPTDPRSAAAVAAANLRALRDGAPLAHLVDRGRGY
jgi:glyoxylate/hydroxypyruvate reductase A